MGNCSVQRSAFGAQRTDNNVSNSAQSAPVQSVIEKAADALADKVPTSMLAGAAASSHTSSGGLMEQAQSLLGSAGSDGKAGAGDSSNGLLEQAQAMLAGEKKEEESGNGIGSMLSQAQSMLGGEKEEKPAPAEGNDMSALLGQATSMLGGGDKKEEESNSAADLMQQAQGMLGAFGK